MSVNVIGAVFPMFSCLDAGDVTAIVSLYKLIKLLHKPVKAHQFILFSYMLLYLNFCCYIFLLGVEDEDIFRGMTFEICFIRFLGHNSKPWKSIGTRISGKSFLQVSWRFSNPLGPQHLLNNYSYKGIWLTYISGRNMFDAFSRYKFLLSYLRL